MASNKVRELFNLPNNETIFDDFQCTISGMPGRVYLSQSYLCFYSTILGMTTKHIINYRDITKITKVTNALSK